MSTPVSATSWCPPAPEAAVPQDRRELVLGCIRGSLAHLKWRPLLMTGMLRQVLIAQFAQLSNIEETDLVTGDSPAIWQDLLRTGILIESVHRWRGDLAEKRPAILLKRNAFRNMRIVINDLEGVDGRGFEHFTTLWVGSHTAFCIHTLGASCEILATEVQRDLTQFGVILGQQLGLMRFQVTEVGAVSQLAEPGPEACVIPITIGWAYQENWKIETEALPLQGVAVTVNANDC